MPDFTFRVAASIRANRLVELLDALAEAKVLLSPRSLSRLLDETIWGVLTHDVAVFSHPSLSKIQTWLPAVFDLVGDDQLRGCSHTRHRGEVNVVAKLLHAPGESLSLAREALRVGYVMDLSDCSRHVVYGAGRTCLVLESMTRRLHEEGGDDALSTFAQQPDNRILLHRAAAEMLLGEEGKEGSRLEGDALQGAKLLRLYGIEVGT